MARISLLLPTRGRPHLVRRLFDSVATCTDRLEDLEIILYVDDDDKTGQEINDDRFSLLKIYRPTFEYGCVQHDLPWPGFRGLHHVDER